MYFLRYMCPYLWHVCGRLRLANCFIKKGIEHIPHQARGKHGDSCGRKSLDETPQRAARGGSSAPTGRGVFSPSGCQKQSFKFSLIRSLWQLFVRESAKKHVKSRLGCSRLFCVVKMRMWCVLVRSRCAFS
ncbi:hypothetical protein JNUCC1_03116 [Lentibacillus sp. JNUCC-1]|nr:hypothetical protein [Lentibacillus sp. JNUCC-1]